MNGVKPILEVEALRFVQSKVTAATRFCTFWEPSDAYAAKFWLLKIMAIIVPRLLEPAGRPLPELKTSRVNNAQAVAGASQPRKGAVVGLPGWAAKMRRLSPADGRRGCQERN